ncbi:MAG: hypothetical protein Q9168_003843 [Polycauliona sp. 1 TL-2023]
MVLFGFNGEALFDDDPEEEHASDSAVVEDSDKNGAVAEDATLFIPLGLAYQLPRTFYKGSDPEWQSFLQLCRNKKRCAYLQNQLTGMVGDYVGNLPLIERALGKGSVPRKHWLNIDYPDGPPPQYERKGLEIGDDHIQWTTRSVHPLHHAKLQKALWPTSLSSSFWASYKTLALLQYAKLRAYLKLSTEAEPSTSTIAPGLSLPSIPQKMKPPKQEPVAASASDRTADSSESADSKGQPPTSQSTPDPAKSFELRFPPPGMKDDLAAAATAFKRTFSKTWRPASTPPERGTVSFSGLVELVGSKGTAVLEVRGDYHPADSRWTAIDIGVRRLQPNNKDPRGGH